MLAQILFKTSIPGLCRTLEEEGTDEIKEVYAYGKPREKLGFEPASKLVFTKTDDNVHITYDVYMEDPYIRYKINCSRDYNLYMLAHLEFDLDFSALQELSDMGNNDDCFYQLRYTEESGTTIGRTTMFA